MQIKKYLVLGGMEKDYRGRERYIGANYLVKRHHLDINECHLVDNVEDIWAFNRQYEFSPETWTTIQVNG